MQSHDDAPLRVTLRGEYSSSNYPIKQPSRSETQLRVCLHLRAHGLKYQDSTYTGRFRFVSRVKRIFGRRWRFVVTATDGVNWQETAAIKSKRGFVLWGETLGELRSPMAGHFGVDFEITPSEQLSESLAQPMTLRVSVVITTAQAVVSAPAAASGPDNADKSLSEKTAATLPPVPSFPKSPSLTDARRRISSAEDVVGNIQPLSGPATTAVGILNDAPNIEGQASDLYSTWGAVVDKMAWVVMITGKIAEVHPYAKMAWRILSFIPREILDQIERDRNIALLLRAILDAFDIAEVANTWERNKADPRQIKVLEAMIGHCCDCGDFVQSYARNTKFRMSQTHRHVSIVVLMPTFSL
ncbi:hypothetical protein BC834DRAFT_846689 [Gloeopeniophorella convolvens]|nr:hypothetical protein BC834DRAFT_846689 [Gloeopeniophorella convolvens]